ncbi:MAG: hypothetical protein GY801_03210 [bacterium]|nr:hypothetical protein [bacterium]
MLHAALPSSGRAATSSSPVLTHNWDTKDWTVPLGLGLAKLFMFGKTPWSFQVEGFYNVVRPETFGEEVLIKFVVKPVVPNFFAKWVGLDGSKE